MSDAPPGLRVRDDDAGVVPSVPCVLVRNASGRPAGLSVGLARDGQLRTAALELSAGDGRAVDVPDGDGPVTAEVHADGGAATVTFDPADRSPLFVVRERSVLVASN